VGGLFAAEPSGDVSESYRRLAGRYRKLAEDEGANSTVFGAILGGMLVAATGGAAAPVMFGGVMGGSMGASSVTVLEWKRLRTSLIQEQGGTIESLPMRFGTVYQELTPTGGHPRQLRSGLLADAIGHSIANPLIFNDLGTRTGGKIDPGLDQVSAIPVQAACEMFPKHQLLVSNAIGGEIYHSKSMTCPYQEIRVPHVDANPTAAMAAQEPVFTQLTSAGHSAALAQIKWAGLPDEKHPAAPGVIDKRPIWPVHVTLTVVMAKTKPSGEPWDFLGNLPDIEQSTTLSVCDTCDGFGTSASIQGLRAKKEDTLQANWDLGVLRIREGMIFKVKLQDADVSDNDPVGEFVATFVRPGTAVASENPSAKVVFTFGEGVSQ
jgi:hypothetical protein